MCSCTGYAETEKACLKGKEERNPAEDSHVRGVEDVKKPLHRRPALAVEAGGKGDGKQRRGNHQLGIARYPNGLPHEMISQ